VNTMIAALAITLFLGPASATNEAYAVSSFTSLRALEKVFHRSETVHQKSMAAITKSLTSEQAMAVLHKKNITNKAFLQVAELALAKRNLRKKAKQPEGYAGVSGAKKLLNDMIFESSSKYDGEIAKCTEYYARQCALMTTARGEIAASNYIAANSRMHILSSQSTINRCEEDIPTRKLELKEHNSKCSHELKKMNVRLKIILGDIAVLTTILKMTECGEQAFLQGDVGLMKCKDECTKRSFISFQHEGLRKQMDKLKSSLSGKLSHEVMSDLFNGVKGIRMLEHREEPKESAGPNTTMAEPPVPRTEVPKNPCTDPNAGAPSMSTKRAAKCTITASPMCDKLQERFLLIQSGVQDERDDLMEEIQKLEDDCEDTKDTIETQTSNDESQLENAQTKLASATEAEANAGETARQTSKQFKQMNGDLMSTMKTCSTNYINFETELCALRKIRGELFKMQGGGPSKSFFVDCALTKWDAEECSKKCGGGEQKLIRGVITHPNGGAECLPLTAVSACNLHPCPVDCRLSAWNGWSKCSAQCGGGVMQRLRDVKRAMKYGGKPCGAVSETQACNAQACEKDCVLSRWSPWSACSKDCDGGTQSRSKFVKEKAVGEGSCPGQWDKERLQYKSCNQIMCTVPKDKPIIQCNRELDIVLLLDGSGSLGTKGWNAEIEAARMFTDAFKKDEHKAQMSVIVFSGPKYMPGVKKCTGSSKDPVDLKKCGINTVTHFISDMKRVNQLLLSIDWPKGSTLTSLALATAKAELNLGRKDAKSVVVVFTDGRPMSFRKTLIAARELRKSARLMWVPVTAHAPLKFIKRCATRRWQENIVIAKEFSELEKPATVNHIIADMCPKPKKMGLLKKIMGKLR